MLELRPNCEWCDRDLPPESPEARMCSYECTYCAECADTVLHNVCATCGGNLVPRPIRPRINHRQGKALGLEKHPASTLRVHSQWTPEQVKEQSDRLKNTPPDQR